MFAVGLGDFRPDLAALSRNLGTEVQYFGTHRVVEGHAWALARHGELVRSFEYVGDTGEVSAAGNLTEVERGLDLELPDEETVMHVAGAWSIDPQTLDLVASESDTGVFGRLPRP